MKGCDEERAEDERARRASPVVERLFAEAIRAAIPAEGEPQDESGQKELEGGSEGRAGDDSGASGG